MIQYCILNHMPSSRFKFLQATFVAVTHNSKIYSQFDTPKAVLDPHVRHATKGIEKPICDIPITNSSDNNNLTSMQLLTITNLTKHMLDEKSHIFTNRVRNFHP